MKTLKDLQKENLPRLEWKLIIEPKDGYDLMPEDLKALEEYFSNFLAPSERCIACGAVLFGLLGTMRWDIGYGEFVCASEGCGYPGRAMHHNVGPVKALNNFPLQYHPSVLLRREDHEGSEEEQHLAESY